MAVPAFLDTNSLYGEYLCDTLLRLAEAETYRPLWSAGMLEELERNLVEVAGLARHAVAYRIAQMQAAFPDAEVQDYGTLTDAMTCDAKDRHVLAAAVRGRAENLITYNVKDFPDASTAPHEIAVVHPDDFLLDQLDLYPGKTVSVLQRQAADYTRPRMTIEQLLGRLAAAGTPKFAGRSAATSTVAALQLLTVITTLRLDCRVWCLNAGASALWLSITATHKCQQASDGGTAYLASRDRLRKVETGPGK